MSESARAERSPTARIYTRLTSVVIARPHSPQYP